MVSYKRLLVICVVATAMMALMGCAKNGTGDDILPSFPTLTDTEKVSSPTGENANLTPTGSNTEKLSLTPLPGSTSTPAPTSTPKQTSTPAPMPKSTSTPTPTLTPPPAQVVAISPSPKPTSEDWWKTYDFLQGDNGEILPEAIKPDISVAYKVTEDDYSVVPEDIKGMFTKENFPRVDGSTATIPISEAIYQYATGATEEEAQNAIVHTKTSQSYYKLFNKESDILIVYEPADTVVEMMKDNPCIIKPIGLDALVFMANTNNPVDSLTLGQLQRIFTGQLDNWTQVGGDDKPLIAFQRPQGTGSQNLIEKVVMGDLPVRSDNSVTVFYDMDGILEGLLSYNGEDNALGYSVYYYAHNMYYLPELKFMAVDGVLPSVQTISDGSYSLVNPFYAVIRADEPEDSDAHKLFDWLTGETAQQMMMDLGYVPVKIPENAEFGDFQTYGKGNAEVSATRDLKEGEYFIYFNEGTLKSSDDSFSYGTVGDMIIFDHKWDPVMTFYNVSIDEEYYGINTSGKLLINQLRWESYGKDGKAGEYLLRSGYYDINSEKYLWQIDGTLEVLDKERERFVGGWRLCT